MKRSVFPTTVSALGDDEVEAIISTGELARDGHILVPRGAQLDNYRKNPIVLFQHSPWDPVGKAESISVDGDKIRARIRFAPSGISEVADTVRGLVKAGIVNCVSVGFEPLEGKPLDPKKPHGGQRVAKWELLECSFVSVPADTGAVVTARQHREGKVLSASNKEALTEAHGAAHRCRQILAKVLGAADCDDDDDDDDQRAADRARRLRQAEALARRWAPGTFDAIVPRSREAHLRQLEALRRRWPAGESGSV